jgi:hypothetical protein
MPTFFGVVFAARDRLPGAPVNTPDQQDLLLGRVNDHQHRLRDFEGGRRWGERMRHGRGKLQMNNQKINSL